MDNDPGDVDNRLHKPMYCSMVIDFTVIAVVIKLRIDVWVMAMAVGDISLSQLYAVAKKHPNLIMAALYLRE